MHVRSVGLLEEVTTGKTGGGVDRIHPAVAVAVAVALALAFAFVIILPREHAIQLRGVA